jgi:hypothetical protein
MTHCAVSGAAPADQSAQAPGVQPPAAALAFVSGSGAAAAPITIAPGAGVLGLDAHAARGPCSSHMHGAQALHAARGARAVASPRPGCGIDF